MSGLLRGIVAVVHDDPVVLASLGRQLRESGYCSLLFSNRRSALGVLPDIPVDAVVIDGRVAGARGGEVPRRLRQGRRRALVLLDGRPSRLRGEEAALFDRVLDAADLPGLPLAVHEAVAKRTRPS